MWFNSLADLGNLKDSEKEGPPPSSGACAGYSFPADSGHGRQNPTALSPVCTSRNEAPF